MYIGKYRCIYIYMYICIHTYSPSKRPQVPDLMFVRCLHAYGFCSVCFVLSLIVLHCSLYFSDISCCLTSLCFVSCFVYGPLLL